MKVIDYQTMQGGSVLGIFTLEIDKWGCFRVKLKHIKGKNGHFIAFPATKEDLQWVPLMGFEDEELTKKFLAQAKEALGKWLQENPL